MAKPLTYNATIIKRIDYTDSLTTFKIEPDTPLDGNPRFIAGQYMVLGLNNEAKPELGSVRRPMSIASAPEEDGPLEFYIRYVSHPESNNPLTHLLWKTKAGDRIFLGPKVTGHFTLDHTVGGDDARLKILVAAGTGLAPFTSMARSHLLRDPSADLKSYAILHGASYPADLGYKEELEGLAAEKGLHYLCTVSRPKEAPDWAGDAGRVEDYFKAERLDATEAALELPPGGLIPQNALIYICGLQGTIGKTVGRMIGRGFVPENRRLRKALVIDEGLPPSLFFEQYDTTPVIDVKDPELLADLRDQLAVARARGWTAQ